MAALTAPAQASGCPVRGGWARAESSPASLRELGVQMALGAACSSLVGPENVEARQHRGRSWGVCLVPCPALLRPLLKMLRRVPTPQEVLWEMLVADPGQKV